MQLSDTEVLPHLTVNMDLVWVGPALYLQSIVVVESSEFFYTYSWWSCCWHNENVSSQLCPQLSSHKGGDLLMLSSPIFPSALHSKCYVFILFLNKLFPMPQRSRVTSKATHILCTLPTHAFGALHRFLPPSFIVKKAEGSAQRQGT